MNDLDQPEPAPTTPVSPNKRKFSFRFPSAGHHDHDAKNERRNFSDEAQSITDLQVCEKQCNDKLDHFIYCKMKELHNPQNTEKSHLNNESLYVDMSGNKAFKYKKAKIKTSVPNINTCHVSKLINSKNLTLYRSQTVNNFYVNVATIHPRKRFESCPNALDWDDEEIHL